MERAAKTVWVAPHYKDAEEGAAYERLRAELLGEAPAHLPLLLERVRRLAKLEGDARTVAALQARTLAVCAGRSCAGNLATATHMSACICICTSSCNRRPAHHLKLDGGECAREQLQAYV